MREPLSPNPTLKDLPVVLTVDEVATLLRVNRKTVYVAIEAHQLPARRVGGVYRIRRDALLEWLQGEGPNSRPSRSSR
jgi:excisionase family DNA binding protein